MYYCYSCNYLYPSNNSLKKHYKTKKHQKIVNNDNNNDNNIEQSNYYCSLCNKNYSQSSNFYRHKKKCNIIEKQVRSADEPATQFITCLECGHVFTIN
jgi:DNA-directed RNA polymerase subunit M/transcription elongation factor TFIIS